MENSSAEQCDEEKKSEQVLNNSFISFLVCSFTSLLYLNEFTNTHT